MGQKDMADGTLSPAHDRPTPASLSSRIRSLSEASAHLEVAQFRFIGLDDIRERYGARWPEKQARVQMVARHFISRRLRPGDIVVGGADGFLVVFADPDSGEARTAAAAIADALNAFFLGEEFGRELSCTARVDTMDAGALSALADALPAQPRPPAASKVRFLFQPVWAAAHQAITSYFLTPIDSAGGRIGGYHFDPMPAGAAPFVDLDELQLRQSAVALGDLIASGGRALVGVTVHATSLRAHADRARLIAILAGCREDLRKFRVLRISCVEPGFPRMHLEETIRLLRPFCPRITLGMHWSDPDVASLLAMRPDAIGFPLHHDARGLIEPGETAHARIRTAAAMAKRAGVQVFSNGDFSFATARRLLGDGVELISSPVIWPRLAQPSSMVSWPASRLSPEA